jgi:hypothetical protein
VAWDFPPVYRITSELRCDVVIDNVGNGDGLFRLTISCLIDRYAEAVTRLPGVFHIWVLLNAADDGFSADADTGGFSVPPKELPTIRSTPPMAEPQISSLIADAHDPSSGDCCTGDELMPAWMELRVAGPAMPENSGPVGDFVVKKCRWVLLP